MIKNSNQKKTGQKSWGTFFSRPKNWFTARKNGIGWKLFWSYLFAIVIGSVLLSIEEISIEEGQEALSYEDAFFITTSAFTDTGLSPVNISEKLNFFGEFIVMICIQIGGIGLMAAKYLLWSMILKKSSSASSKELLYMEKGGITKNSSETMIRRSLIAFFVILGFSTLIFTLYLHNKPQADWGSDSGDNINPTTDFGHAFWYGLFHSVSAMNNAGFDIFGGRSLEIFSHDMFFLIFTVILFILGGIGFPVLYDLTSWIHYKRIHKKAPKLTLLSKLTLSGYFMVMLVGFLLTLAGEGVYATSGIVDSTGNTPLFNDSTFTTVEKGMVLFFHTASARSAGFAYYPIESLGYSTGTIIGVLMFIGAGPSSTGGGVRVTAFSIVVVGLARYRKSGSQLNLFKRTLHPETRRSAFRTVIASAAFVVFVSLILSFALFSGDKTTGEAFSKGQGAMFFETVSAFGTTGLSYKGTTASMPTFSKIMICLMMIVGQLGVNNVLTIVKKGGKSSHVAKKFPVQRVLGI